jgi:hypothetical protein
MQLCPRLNGALKVLKQTFGSLRKDAEAGEERSQWVKAANEYANLRLPNFQVTTRPELRFRALLSDGAQEVRPTHYLR